jgi:hypothetical protein
MIFDDHTIGFNETVNRTSNNAGLFVIKIIFYKKSFEIY